jgi:hypothetical protein
VKQKYNRDKGKEKGDAGKLFKVKQGRKEGGDITREGKNKTSLESNMAEREKVMNIFTMPNIQIGNFSEFVFIEFLYILEETSRN